MIKKQVTQRIRNATRSSIVIGLSILFLVACGGSSSDNSDGNGSSPNDTSSVESSENGSADTGSTPSGEPVSTANGFSETLQLNGTVQDVWTFESVSIIETDGTARDITDDILQAYLPDASEAVVISDSATFREFVDLKPSIHNSSETVRDHIDVVAGVIETDDRQLLVMVATPDVSVGGLITGSDRLLFDITRLEDEIPAGEPLVLDYYFAVTTPAAEPDAAANGIELLTERLADGRFIIQTESPEPDSDPLLLAGNIGTTFEGSRGAGLPAKSGPLICGLPTASGKCGPLCAGRALYDIYKGFKQSWTSIEKNFEPGTGSSPPPISKCPSGQNCAQSGNDPHIRTFDGLSYSPQAVGEFTAIDYQSANTSIEMQWRFSPGVNNRTVSFITAVALDIDGTRLMIDPNRENIVSVDGEAVTFDDMGNPFIDAVNYDNSSGISISAPRGSIYIQTDLWSWLFSFSGRGFTPGQQWIKVLVNAPGGITDIRGMFGNADGKPIGDLISKDELFVVPALSQATVADLYDGFVNTWRISEGESLFEYGTNESSSTFTDASFPDFPNLVDGRNTLLLEARKNQSSSTSTGRAEAVCRLAGVNEQPGFDECVTDILTTGDFEIANDSIVMSGLDRVIKTSRFGADIDGKDLRWWHVVEGPATPKDGNLIGNDTVTLMTTITSEDVATLTAVDTQSGVKLWELDGVMPRCGAALPSVDKVVVQMASLGGMALLDAYSGEELDRYVVDGSLPSCSVALQTNSKSQVFHDTRNTRTAFDIVDNSIALRWVSTNSADPMLSGVSNFDGSLVLADDLFILGRSEGSEDVSIFRIDSDTGLATSEAITRVRSKVDIEAGGDDLIVVSGTGSGRVTWIHGFRADSSPIVSSLWERQLGSTTADGVTSLIGRMTYNDDGFANWAKIDGKRGVARFNPDTGIADWHTPATSFDNNGQLVTLSDGGFAIAPFGSANFVEAYSRDGSFAWSIPYPAGTDFPVGLRATGRDTMSVVSRNGDNGDAMAFVSVGTRR